MATIREVAVRAGVSTATVSYALNRPDRVNPQLRARVEEAARALDYHPDGAARCTEIVRRK
jgi:LacI family transcriptional regulator